MIEAFLVFLTHFFTGVLPQSRGFSFEDPKQKIYFANHTSHFDTLLLWSLMPQHERRKVRPVAAKDYWWTSRLRRFFAEKIFNAIPIARYGELSKENPLDGIHSALNQDSSIIFFPEGTRGDGSKIQKFKSGLYHLVTQKPSVMLVPVYIRNVHRVLPKKALLPVPIVCTVIFGEGFHIEQGESKEQFLTRAYEQLERLSYDPIK